MVYDGFATNRQSSVSVAFHIIDASRTHINHCNGRVFLHVKQIQNAVLLFQLERIGIQHLLEYLFAIGFYGLVFFHFKYVSVVRDSVPTKNRFVFFIVGVSVSWFGTLCWFSVLLLSILVFFDKISDTIFATLVSSLIGYVFGQIKSRSDRSDKNT